MQLGRAEGADTSVGSLPQVLAGQVGLVEDIAHDLLEHILERNEPLEIPVLVDDQRHVTTRLPERPQQRIERYRFGDDDRVVHEILPTHVVRRVVDKL